MISGPIAKKYDAIIASMAITPKREEVVDFTKKYYSAPAKFIAAKGSHFDLSPAGLKGKTRSGLSAPPSTRISCTRNSLGLTCAPTQPRTKPTPTSPPAASIW